MRHLVWLSGILLALSCTVDNSNLDVDAGGGGGAGGCPRCVGTGGAGGGQSGGATGTGGAAAGATGTGGSVTGTGGAGGSAGTGQTGTGGSVTGTGGAGGSGTGGNATGTGGNGTGGKGQGGMTGTGGKGQGGQAGAASCDAIATDYSNALTAAKKCTQGAANQCQQLVDGSISCPGCKTYVNDVTMLTAIEDRWTAAGCDSMHFVCPAIACIAPGQGVCTSSPGGQGPGGNSSGTCSSTQLTPVGQ